jgi:hypothetical protein
VNRISAQTRVERDVRAVGGRRAAQLRVLPDMTVDTTAGHQPRVGESCGVCKARHAAAGSGGRMLFALEAIAFTVVALAAAARRPAYCALTYRAQR